MQHFSTLGDIFQLLSSQGAERTPGPRCNSVPPLRPRLMSSSRTMNSSAPTQNHMSGTIPIPTQAHSALTFRCALAYFGFFGMRFWEAGNAASCRDVVPLICTTPPANFLCLL